MIMDNEMKRLLFCALIVCCVVACEKRDIAEDLLSVEAGLPSQPTKTALGSKAGNYWPLFWSAGDCLMLNGVQSTALSAADAGGATATFKFAGVGGATVWNYTYCGVAGSDCTVTFPASQSSNGNIAVNTLPMYASSSTPSGSITLSPLGAVLRFSFTSSSAVTVSRIEVKAIGGESICGDYTIGKSAGLLNGSLAASGNNRDNILIAAGVALSSSPSAFCFVLPAGTYASGFQANITASDGTIMEVWFNTRSNKTLSAGVLYDFGEAAFVPMGTSVMAVVSTENFTVDTVSY